MIYNVQLDDLLIPTDSFDSAAKFWTLDDVIQLTDTIDSHRYIGVLSDRLQFMDRTSVNEGAVFNCSLSDTLTFLEEVHPRRHIESFDDFLYLMDWLTGPELQQLRDTLTFVDSITGWSGPAALDILTLDDSFNYTYVKNNHITDSITLTDHFVGYVNDPWIPVYTIVEEA